MLLSLCILYSVSVYIPTPIYREELKQFQVILVEQKIMLIAKVVEEVFQELKEHLLKMSWGFSFLTKYTLKNIDQNNVLAYLQKSEFFSISIPT